ncbi:MAG: S41 family peptidase [Opitutaceae bacterium]
MRKRFFAATACLVVGVGVPAATLHFAALFGLVPDHGPGRAIAYVKDVLELVHENYVDPAAVGYDDLAHSAIDGMVDSLDPHSEFLEAKDNQDLEEDLSGQFGGVGIQVEVRGGKITVVNPMPGTPAERAGIRRGDEVVSIGGRAVSSAAAMDDVVDQLRGKPHTFVSLGVYRPSAGRRLSFRLERENINVDSVTNVHVVDRDIGYVLITEFSENTGQQFSDALGGLLKRNIDSLIIDLRNNPGGLLDSAVEVAEPFFRKGELIVYTQGRKPSDREEFRSENEGDPLDLPVAVLINEDTASAAEIVTGALKDTGRAVIVGERSFGKGTVQSIFKLRNGEGLRLTTAKYYTPSGISINDTGISPEVKVVMTSAEDDDLRLQAARPDITDPAEFKQEFGFEPIDDRQLDAAVAVLDGVDVLDSQAPRPPEPAKATPPVPAQPASARAAILPHHSNRPLRLSGAPRCDRG